MTTDRVDVIDRSVEKIANEAGLAGETEASIAATTANRVLRRHVSAGEAGSVLHELPGICEGCSHRRRSSTMDRGDVYDVSNPRS